MSDNRNVEVLVTIHLINGQSFKASFKLEGTATETIEQWIKRFAKEDGVYTYIYDNKLTSFKYSDVVSIEADLGEENKNFTLSDVAEEVRRNFDRWNYPGSYNSL